MQCHVVTRHAHEYFTRGRLQKNNNIPVFVFGCCTQARPFALALQMRLTAMLFGVLSFDRWSNMAAWATPELAHVDLNWNIIRKVHKRWTSIAMFEYQRGNHLDLFNDLIFFCTISTVRMAFFQCAELGWIGTWSNLLVSNFDPHPYDIATKQQTVRWNLGHRGSKDLSNVCRRTAQMPIFRPKKKQHNQTY